MKNTKFELMRHLQRQHHRNNPWRLSKDGLYIPHSYDDVKPHSQSWWDDVGFILNGRKVIVWWCHPRYVYSGAIRDQSWKEAGDSPNDDWLFEGGTTNYRKAGKSRKKIVSYTSRQPSEEQQMFYDKLEDIEKRLASEGIEFDVSTSWQRERLSWATGVSLVAPLEVRNEDELALVAKLARRLVLGQTTLDAEFPGYRYCKSDYLREQELRAIGKQP